MKRNILYIVGTLLIASLYACTNKPVAEEESAAETNTVVITREQYENAKMHTGTTETRTIEERITANAVVSLPPDGMARISVPVAGVISSIHHQTGDFVKKGSVLIKIKSLEAITLQQEYAETSSRFRAMSDDYERQVKLFGEKVTSKKEFVNLEGEYKSMKAKREGLKARLRLLNIDPQKTEDGIIADEIHIIAAIDGYVSRLDAVSGQYVNPGNEVIEQINSAKFLLKIQIFEQDLDKLKSGQNVVISNASKQFIYPAVLKTIGKSVDPLTHTIECLATIQAPETSELVNGMILSAHITYSEREAKTLPDQALIKSGKQLYILVKESETAEKITFIKTKITAGVSQGGFTEILNSKDLQNVLLNGVSDIPLEE